MAKLFKDEQGIKWTLSPELFPLGSLDSNAGVEIIREIVNLIENKGAAEDVELSFRLLDRFVDEIIFLQNQKGNVSQRSNFVSWQRLFRSDKTPFGLVLKVVHAWSEHDSNGIASLSPRNVFEKVKKWEKGLIPDFHSEYYTYTMKILLRVACSSTDPELPEEIILYLLASIGEGQTSVTVVTFNSAIDAWAKSDRADAPQRAEALLRKMIDLSDKGWVEVAPDDRTFNLVIFAWAMSGHENAPQRAEDILHLMESYASLGVKADADTYFLVMFTWARSDFPDAALRAQSLFDEMQQKYEAGDDAMQPNSSVYNALIKAWATSDHKDAPQRAEDILCQMESDASLGVKTNADTIALVIAAWARSDFPDAALRAQSLFDKMQQKYEAGDDTMRPNSDVHNALIGAWATSDHENAPQRAEDILHLMESNASLGVKANADTIALVIAAWADSDFPDAAIRAQSLFDEMQLKYEAGDDTMRPNSNIYLALIMALAKSGHEDAPQHAEDILRLMESNFSLDVKADANTYYAVMFAWALSDFPDACIRAQSLFDEMQQKYEAGDDTMRPNSFVYEALIKAWVNSGHENAPQRAEDIFRQMESNPSLDVKANANTINLVMLAWARSDFPDAAIRAQSLFDEMQQKYEAGDDTMQPNRNVYEALIKAWGRSEHNDRVAKAQAAFDHMVACYESGAKELKPDFDVYIALILVLSTAGYPERAEQLIYQMESNGVTPGAEPYVFVLYCWFQSDAPDAFDRMFALYEDMKGKVVTVHQELEPLSLLFEVLLCAWSRSSNRQDQLSKAQVVYEDMVACFDCGAIELAPLVDMCSFLKKTD